MPILRGGGISDIGTQALDQLDVASSESTRGHILVWVQVQNIKKTDESKVNIKVLE